MFETKEIDVKKIKPNSGQITGLPKNPRLIKDSRFDKLKKSIRDLPDMLHLRELIVVPHGETYVVIAGNMRLRAMIDLGFKAAPCKVLDASTPVDKLKQYTIKDNVDFGENDFELLANEWDVGELEEWGLELPVVAIDTPTGQDLMPTDGSDQGDLSKLEPKWVNCPHCGGKFDASTHPLQNDCVAK